jgi:hypothetical protein
VVLALMQIAGKYRRKISCVKFISREGSEAHQVLTFTSNLEPVLISYCLLNVALKYIAGQSFV